ncbi:helix-turn-helix transcriptional regulator [Jannaschia sp. LMIT008]|uniref:helix-turn-helix transcriptional regulator n=1 Tax=Jannaschia maritima TaxID=3032585 RepID=UPI00281203A0|nr:helix-turn-helix transcriptional regulator [Jannaschia sp. LMIT008]
MAKIHLFEHRRLSEVNLLSGLAVESVTPLARSGRWRRELPHAESLSVLIWVARGQGRILLDGIARTYLGGTLIALPAGTPFALQPGPITEATLVRVPDLFEAPMPGDPAMLRLPQSGVQAELVALLDALSSRGGLGDPVACRAALGRVILLSALVESQRHRAIPLPDRPVARRFVHAVEGVVRADALPQIGRTIGILPDDLNAAMWEASGMTATEWLSARVLHEARSKLAEAGASPAAVADALGFADAGALTVALREGPGREPRIIGSAGVRRDQG